MTRLLCLLLVLLALPAQAREKCDFVCDGDTIELHGTRWRIHGIDAPEKDQVCPDGWQAGIAATAHLRSFLAGKTVTCGPTSNSRDRYDRVIGRCRANGIDIGAEMVMRGLAWSFTRYSVEYAPLEDQARALRVGIHQHNCQVPWEWRAEKRR